MKDESRASWEDRKSSVSPSSSVAIGANQQDGKKVAFYFLVC